MSAYMIFTVVAINVVATVVLFHIITKEHEEDPYE